MLFEDLQPGQKFKFKFDSDSNFIYEKIDCCYFSEVSIPAAYGTPRFGKYDIASGALDTCEVIEYV
jgi:hypothetical protein